MTVGALGFDIDHTLGIDNRLEFTVALELLGGRGRRQDVEASLASYRSGAQSVDDAMSAIGVPAERFRRLVLDRTERHVQCLPGTRELLELLRRRDIPVAILSNGWSPLQERKAELLGFVGPVLVSDVIGAAKPARAAFEALERALGVAATQTAYVGDDPAADVAGALGAGMSGIWFDWEGKTYPQECPRPSLRITALMDLTRVLPGPHFDAANPHV